MRGSARWGLLVHPMVLGSVLGAIGGEPGVGMIVGLGLLAAFETGEDEPSQASLVGGLVGPLVGLLLARQGVLGGFLGEAFVAIVLGAAAGWLARPLLQGRPSLDAALQVTLGALGAGAAGAVLLAGAPELARSAGPWTAGLVLMASCARLAGLAASARADGRLLVLLPTALLANLAGPLAAPLLLLGALGPRLETLLPPLPRRVLVGLLAAAAAWLLGWLPYRLPAWESAWLPGPPGTGIELSPLANLAGRPLILGACLLAAVLGGGRAWIVAGAGLAAVGLLPLL